MEAYLICGLSCSGQTSVGVELKRRGYEAIDTDDVFAYWGDLKTEKPVNFPDLDNLTEEWFNYNGWIWDRKKVEETFQNSNIIFFCGSSDKDPEYFSRFKMIFRLYVDEDTLKKRLMERDSSFHSSQFYVAGQLQILQIDEEYAHNYNMIRINTAQYSVSEVVDIILKYISNHNKSNFKLKMFDFHRFIKASNYKYHTTRKRLRDYINFYYGPSNKAINKKHPWKFIPYGICQKLVKKLNRKVKFGGLRRLTPISRQFGYDRGVPIDRFYIENFLAINNMDIRGRVLEIGDATYTNRFGGDRVIQSDVLHITEGNPDATIIGDLTRADHIPSGTFNCIILTQTLNLIYDIRSALATLYRILKPGGTLLVTVPGISQVVKQDWGDDWYWAFTDQSVRLLFEEYFGRSNIHVESHGNVLAAIAFLHGIAQEELKKEELLHQDDEYQVTITVRAVKTKL